MHTNLNPSEPEPCTVNPDPLVYENVTGAVVVVVSDP